MSRPRSKAVGRTDLVKHLQGYTLTPIAVGMFTSNQMHPFSFIMEDLQSELREGEFSFCSSSTWEFFLKNVVSIDKTEY